MDIDLGTWLGQVGVGGIFLILVLRMVLDFVAKFQQHKAAKEQGDAGGNRSATTGEHSILERKLAVLLQKVDPIEKQMADVHAWMSKEDGDGVKLVYTRRSLEEAIVALAESLDRQTKVLAEVAREQRTVIDGQKDVITKMSKITGDLPRFREPSRGG